MAKTLVFHIGDPKTGTSSIQQVLMDKSYTSNAVSLDYQPWLNAFPLANYLYEADHLDPGEPLFAEVSAWLAKSTADISVISAEMFFRVDPVVLQRALDLYLPDRCANRTGGGLCQATCRAVPGAIRADFQDGHVLGRHAQHV